MPDSIVVTGGSGFIGRMVVDGLVSYGYTPIVVDKSTGLDVRSDEARALVEKSAGVIHLAGVLGTDELFDEPHKAIDVNIAGTMNMLQGCKTNQTPFVGITLPNSGWLSVYAISKKASKDFATAWHREYGVPVTHVRAFNAFGAGQAHGPGHPRKIIPYFATQAWNKKPIEIWGDGTQTVDLISTAEIARVLVEALQFGGDDQTIDAGSGIEYTVNDVASKVIHWTGSAAGIVHGEMRRGEVPHTRIKAEGEGWELLTRPPSFSWTDVQDAVESYKP